MGLERFLDIAILVVAVVTAIWSLAYWRRGQAADAAATRGIWPRGGSPAAVHWYRMSGYILAGGLVITVGLLALRALVAWTHRLTGG